MNGSGHTPLFHISKRSALPWYLSWAIRLAAIVLALIVCALVTTLLTGVSPLGVYATIIQGSFGTVRKFLEEHPEFPSAPCGNSGCSSRSWRSSSACPWR